jgi:hypothetical protein
MKKLTATIYGVDQAKKNINRRKSKNSQRHFVNQSLNLAMIGPYDEKRRVNFMKCWSFEERVSK